MNLPSTIAQYRIVSKLGEGGMGEVWRATDTKLNRDIAIKVLPPAFARDSDRLRRFVQEAQAAASLSHPNIVAVYDAGESDGIAYLVTELLEGEALRVRLTPGPLAIRKAVDYAAQVALGLAAAHAKRIVHRDIKPENLFVTREGPVKILDFGLAKVSSATAVEGTSAPTAFLETTPGVVLGTVGYMSPEQVRGAVVGHRSDIFSLGAVLYEMLAGRRAFEGESAADIMSAIIKEDPPQLPAGVPALVTAIVRRCLEKNPEERFESARDLAFALQSISGESGPAAALQSAPAPRRALWRAALAVLVIAAIAGAWILAKRTGQSEPLQFSQVTFRRGLISGARFANDGKNIIYSAAWDGKPAELFITQQGSPESRPLGIRDAHVVAISRTGEMALILSPRAGFWLIPTAGTLARMPVSGGAPREIAENVAYADWSPDGTQLAVVRQLAGGQVLEYPMGKALYESPGVIFGPKISPRGDMVAFLESGIADTTATIVVVDLNRKKRILHTITSALGFTWSPDGTEIRFSGWEAGNNSSIKAIDLKGNVRVILGLPGMYGLMDGAPDGRLLLMLDSFVAGMYFGRLGSAAETDLYWHDNSVVRDLSPDGKQVLFSEGAAAATPDWATYMRGTGGSPAVRLGVGMATAFSRDGKWAMLNPTAPRAQLIAFPTRAGSTQALTADEISHVAGRWLNDGTRIVFVGSESGHRLRYYVQESPAVPPRPISSENIVFDRYSDPIVISPDGKSLAAAIDGKGIQLMAIEGGEPQPIPGTAEHAPLAWCRDGGILIYRPGEIPAQVVRADPKTGGQRPWKELVPPDRTALGLLGPIRIAADCESYAYTAQYDPSRLFVVNGAR
jgi:Tol biopolymer transport system component